MTASASVAGSHSLTATPLGLETAAFAKLTYRRLHFEGYVASGLALPILGRLQPVRVTGHHAERHLASIATCAAPGHFSLQWYSRQPPSSRRPRLPWRTPRRVRPARTARRPPAGPRIAWEPNGSARSRPAGA